MDVCIESFRKVICDVEHPFADLAYSQGEPEHEQHYIAEQTFQLVLRKSMIRLVHHDIYKGGAHSEISTGTQGEYEQRNAFLGKRISWFALCP